MHKYYATHYTIDRFQDQCLKKCTKFEYKGKFEATDRWHSNPRIVDIWYWLSSKKIKVYEEYLVYDTENVIGYIGGTLGLFIGFSFQNVLYGGLTFLENYLLQHVINDPTYQIRIWIKYQNVNQVWKRSLDLRNFLFQSVEKKKKLHFTSKFLSENIAYKKLLSKKCQRIFFFVISIPWVCFNVGNTQQEQPCSKVSDYQFQKSGSTWPEQNAFFTEVRNSS